MVKSLRHNSLRITLCKQLSLYKVNMWDNLHIIEFWILLEFFENAAKEEK